MSLVSKEEEKGLSAEPDQSVRDYRTNVRFEGSVKCKKRLSPVPAQLAFPLPAVDKGWGHTPRGVSLGGQTKCQEAKLPTHVGPSPGRGNE